jgi:hypothetical protein
LKASQKIILKGYGTPIAVLRTSLLYISTKQHSIGVSYHSHEIRDQPKGSMVTRGQIFKTAGKPPMIFLADHRAFGCLKLVVKVTLGHMGPLGRICGISMGGTFLGGERKFSLFFDFFNFFVQIPALWSQIFFCIVNRSFRVQLKYRQGDKKIPLWPKPLRIGHFLTIFTFRPISQKRSKI